MKLPPLPDALLRRIEPLIEMERKLRERKALALGLFIGSVIVLGGVWIATKAGWPAERVWLWSALGVLTSVVVATLIAKAWRVDVMSIARRIEAEHPDLKAALITALQLQPGEEGFGYLQQRVVVDAVLHAQDHDWVGRRNRWRLGLWGVGVGTAAVVWLASLAFTHWLTHRHETPAAVAQQQSAAPVAPTITVNVRPGDTEVERGTRLIVEAKFAGGTPTEVTMILSDDAEGKAERTRVPLRATVETGSFGGMFPQVDKDGFYRVVYAEGASKSFKVTTYVHPELVRADAIITPPEYSGQPVKEIKNTQNVSALQGSQVKFRMKINKPVAQAELYGEDKVSLPLTPSKDDPLTLEGTMQPDKTQKYRLHLVDAQERANKQPPWFNVRILEDQLPKVDIVFPKRDLAVSPIQEMPLEAKVWDDLGVKRSGAVFMLGSDTREVSLSDAKLTGKEHHSLKTMLDLEKMKAEPRQLISYYVWAEDVSPEGKTRRAQSDMFFAEVRHFEDIFREGESPPGEGEPGKQSDSAKLGRLQKEIVNADWKLVRDRQAGKKFESLGKDMQVVKESQDIAIKQAEEAIEKVEDREIKAALMDAGKAMQRASDVLDAGLKNQNADALTDALVPEREALEALYRAQSREHLVMRSQSKSQGGGQQMEQRQLSQLEMKQKDKRYEEEKAAGDEKMTAEQEENLQVLNRLKELARRQEALLEKMKEVEQRMAQAKTEEERQELAQQLKRLQEEQQQLLRDIDDLKERMEKPENQAQMAQEMKQLDEAREQAREAAEKLAQQQAGGAANAATRAQEQLEQVRDEFRQRTAKRFADELKQLKQDAAGLAGNEEKLSEALASQDDPRSSAGSNDLEKQLEKAKLNRAVTDQRESFEKLMEQMRQLSEQAEQAEPLLSTALNDAARRAAADGIDKSLEDVSTQMRWGTKDDAQASERKAAKGIEQLQAGVEKAAESVLGSETESLRMARNELDRLLKEASKGTEQGQPGQEGKDGQRQGAQGQPQDGNAQASAEKGEQGKEGARGEQGKEGQGASPSAQEGKEKALAANVPGQGQAPKGQPQQPGQGQGSQTAEERAQENAPGQQPGEGQGKSQQQQQAQASSQGKGEGQSPSQGQGQGQQPQTAANDASGQQGQGMQPGRGESPGQGQVRDASGQGQPQGSQSQRGQVARGGQRDAGGGDRMRGGEREAGGGGGDEGGWFFNDNVEIAQNDSPITGANYEQWSDGLRRVEEALTSPELRNQAARVLDRARDMRTDWRRNDAAPQADIVRMHIVQPLVELRDRVSEELARRESKNPLSPLDRDPVPNRYREQVRRYYTELGGGK